MSKINIKKGDKVIIISGKDKGKTGKVLSTVPDEMKVLVEGVNMSVKHKKPKGRYQQGGKINQETPIYSSKAMVVCKNCGKPTKIGNKILDDGTKVRVCKNNGCGEQLDA
ncbi:MAG: 50S ribosomal protein L24 [Ignavibacteriales bacterium]